MNLGFHSLGMTTMCTEGLLHLKKVLSAIAIFIHRTTTWAANPVLHAIKPALGAELTQRRACVLISITIKVDTLPNGLSVSTRIGHPLLQRSAADAVAKLTVCEVREAIHRASMLSSISSACLGKLIAW